MKLVHTAALIACALALATASCKKDRPGDATTTSATEGPKSPGNPSLADEAPASSSSVNLGAPNFGAQPPPPPSNSGTTADASVQTPPGARPQDLRGPVTQERLGDPYKQRVPGIAPAAPPGGAPSMSPNPPPSPPDTRDQNPSGTTGNTGGGAAGSGKGGAQGTTPGSGGTGTGGTGAGGGAGGATGGGGAGSGGGGGGGS